MMSETKYTEDHEWIRVDGDIGTVGITDYAQGQLGDVVYVELPTKGKTVTQGGDMAVVESVKAASEVYAPVSGEIIDANETLSDKPECINGDAMGAGWFVKLKLADKSQLAKLMDEAQYKKFLESLA
jgi:glycine cleavage system H protein